MILLLALAAAFVEVRDVPSLPADAAAWNAIPAARVRVTPQHTIRLNDRDANASPGAAQDATVRVAADAAQLALLVEWSDATEDRTRPDSTDAFGDAAALQLPLQFGKGLRLPFIGMGDEQMHVALFHQRATQEGTAGREAVAAGFGSTTRADLGQVRMSMQYDGQRKGWRALFVLPLQTSVYDLKRGLVPFAIAVWDGAHHQRGGNKLLSSWQVLRLTRFPADEAYAQELGDAPVAGDAARGKQLVEAICTPCHAVGDKRIAPPGLAPDLSAIGAIATPAYLRDSILAPSSVIVPNLPAGQHQDRAKPPDAYGAAPNSDAFVWSRLDAGKRVSKMPPFAALPPADVAAIVAYLATLRGNP